MMRSTLLALLNRQQRRGRGPLLGGRLRAGRDDSAVVRLSAERTPPPPAVVVEMSPSAAAYQRLVTARDKEWGDRIRAADEAAIRAMEAYSDLLQSYRASEAAAIEGKMATAPADGGSHLLAAGAEQMLQRRRRRQDAQRRDGSRRRTLSDEGQHTPSLPLPHRGGSLPSLASMVDEGSSAVDTFRRRRSTTVTKMLLSSPEGADVMGTTNWWDDEDAIGHRADDEEASRTDYYEAEEDGDGDAGRFSELGVCVIEHPTAANNNSGCSSSSSVLTPIPPPLTYSGGDSSTSAEPTSAFVAFAVERLKVLQLKGGGGSGDSTAITGSRSNRRRTSSNSDDDDGLSSTTPPTSPPPPAVEARLSQLSVEYQLLPQHMRAVYEAMSGGAPTTMDDASNTNTSSSSSSSAFYQELEALISYTVSTIKELTQTGIIIRNNGSPQHSRSSDRDANDDDDVDDVLASVLRIVPHQWMGLSHEERLRWYRSRPPPTADVHGVGEHAAGVHTDDADLSPQVAKTAKRRRKLPSSLAEIDVAHDQTPPVGDGMEAGERRGKAVGRRRMPKDATEKPPEGPPLAGEPPSATAAAVAEDEPMAWLRGHLDVS